MDRLITELRKYRLDTLLELLGKISQDLFKENKAIEELVWRKDCGSFTRVVKQYLPAWNLADLSYFAIKSSNDYRQQIPTKQTVYDLNNLLIAELDREAAKKKTEQNEFLLRFALGMSQKQFWYQEIIRGGNLYYNFLRYYVLLYEMPKSFPDHKLPDQDLLELTGFNIEDFSKLLMAGWSLNQSSSPYIPLIVDKELTEKIPIITEENLFKCLEYFVGDYQFYRMESHPNNPLFFRPIIKTDSNKLVISNSFLWARKFYEGIYWLLRDDYAKKGSLDFINNFGKYYEEYVANLLDFYLNEGGFEKIETSNTEKRADWIIYTNKYILIVEQKSCLMTIELKQEYPSIELLDRYLNNFKEACQQLADTSRTVNSNDEKTIIKLVLHFEKMHFREKLIKDRVSSLCEDMNDDLELYYFIDTEEFEKIIQILSCDEKKFNAIIEKKMEIEKNNSTLGGDFHSIIQAVENIVEIGYLDQYSHFFDDLFGKLQ